MLRFPVKKIRKQFKLLLLVVLLTFAIWFTYLHINQGKTIKLHTNYGKDVEELAGNVTNRIGYLSGEFRRAATGPDLHDFHG
ncbi:hypothetical protein GJAV_G00244320 [Gymnothorax javanicus]|nr:hypothetical protein GJAV_G00244320 [Gymnothorax javanicus]